MKWEGSSGLFWGVGERSGGIWISVWGLKYVSVWNKRFVCVRCKIWKGGFLSGECGCGFVIWVANRFWVGYVCVELISNWVGIWGSGGVIIIFLIK